MNAYSTDFLPNEKSKMCARGKMYSSRAANSPGSNILKIKINQVKRETKQTLCVFAALKRALLPLPRREPAPVNASASRAIRVDSDETTAINSLCRQLIINDQSR